MTEPITIIQPGEPGYLTAAAHGYESMPGIAWHSGGFASSNCPSGMPDHPIPDWPITVEEQVIIQTMTAEATAYQNALDLVTAAGIKP